VVTVGQSLHSLLLFHMLILLPLVGKLERPRPLPSGIGAAMLGGGPARRRRRRWRSPEMLKRAFAAVALSRFRVGSAARQGRTGPADETRPLPHQEWSFDGIFGTYGPGLIAARFPGYKKSVRSVMRQASYSAISPIWATARRGQGDRRRYQVTDPQPNDQGQMYQRPGRPSDPIPPPFRTTRRSCREQRALPPDLSMIVKAREGGPLCLLDFDRAYKDPPPGFNMLSGMNYNEYFPGIRSRCRRRSAKTP